MKKKLLSKIVPALVAYLIAEMDSEAMKKGLDMLLDWGEEAVAKSETEIDNMIVLPLIEAVRVAFDIPDND